ncbi:hypothetical protein LB503_004126 [Fusarium chuoi]|nr:hypothetical protein LB503_004126 [Fusarium chuoi]
MAIKFIHHKGADRKPKPTIFLFTPTKKQTFCAVSAIIALALHDEAFAASNLTDAASVLQTKIVVTPRFYRRGASNAANGNASDAVRDQMMRHDPKFATFHGAYLNEMAQFDMQNTFLGEQAEDQLYKLFAHVSLTRDPRAVRDMVPEEVWANVEPDPEIVALEQRRTALKGGSYQVQDQRNEAEVRYLTDQIRLKTAQLEKQIVKDWREYYFYNRPTWNIERQARGELDEEHVEPTITLSIPERVKLANILCSRCEDDDDALQRRTMAIELMVALCNKRETGKRRRLSPKLKVTPMKEESPEFEVEPNVDPFPLLLDVKQCPDCFGDERLTVEERTFRYCRPTVRDDHFDDHHLGERERAMQRGEAPRCEHPKCRTLKLESLDYFKNHVASVHGVKLRCSRRVNNRRMKRAKRRQMAKGMSRMD